MNQSEFAKLLQMPPSMVTVWKQRGWLVMIGDCEVDVEASKARLIEKRGTLGRVGKKKAKNASPWSKGPNCKTHRARELHEEWNGG